MHAGMQGQRHGGNWGKQSPHSSQRPFCKSSKTDEKILEVWGGGVTSPTILEFPPDFVTSGFQRPDLTYILPHCKLTLYY